MPDFQVIYMNDILPVRSVRFLPNLIPRTVEIRGKDLRSAISVEFNGIKSPGAPMVVDRRTVYAEFPEAQLRNGAIYDISVISSDVTITRRSRVRFTCLGDGIRTRKNVGILKLIQLFVKLMLTTPGSDSFFRAGGGGLQGALKTTIGKNKAADLSLSIGVSVARVRSQIVAMQSKDRRLPPSERLADAKLGSVDFDQDTTSIYAGVTLQNAEGNALPFNLEL